MTSFSERPAPKNAEEESAKGTPLRPSNSFSTPLDVRDKKRTRNTKAVGPEASNGKDAAHPAQPVRSGARKPQRSESSGGLVHEVAGMGLRALKSRSSELNGSLLRPKKTPTSASVEKGKPATPASALPGWPGKVAGDNWQADKEEKEAPVPAERQQILQKTSENDAKKEQTGSAPPQPRRSSVMSQEDSPACQGLKEEEARPVAVLNPLFEVVAAAKKRGEDGDAEEEEEARQVAVAHGREQRRMSAVVVGSKGATEGKSLIRTLSVSDLPGASMEAENLESLEDTAQKWKSLPTDARRTAQPLRRGSQWTLPLSLVAATLTALLLLPLLTTTVAPQHTHAFSQQLLARLPAAQLLLGPASLPAGAAARLSSEVWRHVGGPAADFFSIAMQHQLRFQHGRHVIAWLPAVTARVMQIPGAAPVARTLSAAWAGADDGVTAAVGRIQSLLASLPRLQLASPAASGDLPHWQAMEQAVLLASTGLLPDFPTDRTAALASSVADAAAPSAPQQAPELPSAAAIAEPAPAAASAAEPQQPVPPQPAEDEAAAAVADSAEESAPAAAAVASSAEEPVAAAEAKEQQQEAAAAGRSEPESPALSASPALQPALEEAAESSVEAAPLPAPRRSVEEVAWELMAAAEAAEVQQIMGMAAAAVVLMLAGAAMLWSACAATAATPAGHTAAVQSSGMAADGPLPLLLHAVAPAGVPVGVVSAAVSAPAAFGSVCFQERARGAGGAQEEVEWAGARGPVAVPEGRSAVGEWGTVVEAVREEELVEVEVGGQGSRRDSVLMSRNDVVSPDNNFGRYTAFKKTVSKKEGAVVLTPVKRSARLRHAGAAGFGEGAHSPASSIATAPVGHPMGYY